MSAYRTTIAVLAFVFIALGVAMVVQTVRHGGGSGYLIGPLFVALGLGRLYLLHRRPRL